MSNMGTGWTTSGWRDRVVPTLALTAAALIAGAGPASAHGGDASKIHGCLGAGNGQLSIVGPNDSCKKNESALGWSATDTNTTYQAGTGLTLTGNVFSVASVPWSALTGVPAGLDDGDDVGGPADVPWDDIDGVPADLADGDQVGLTEVGWEDLADIPADIADGDDDGSAQLRSDLANADGTPNEAGDLVSFTKIKDLVSPAGGRILGSFVQDGTLQGQDIADGAITTGKLSGAYFGSVEATPGAVTSEKIRDGAIQGRDLGSVVQMVTTSVNPPSIAAGSRAAVTISGAFLTDVKPGDLVTVSPPSTLDPGLLFTGSNVLSNGEVTVYLNNITANAIDPGSLGWVIRRLVTDG